MKFDFDDLKSPPAQVESRHELHESLQLLQNMRKVGGVRRIDRGGKTIGEDFINRRDSIQSKYGEKYHNPLSSLESMVEHTRAEMRPARLVKESDKRRW